MILRAAALLTVLPILATAAVEAPAGFLVLNDKDYHFPAGTTTVTKSAMTMKDSKMVIDLGEQKIEGTMTMIGADEKEVIYQGKNKARQVLTSFSTDNSMTIGGRKNPLPADEQPLLKVPIILEKVEGKWSARLEDGEPKKAQVEELEEEAEEWNNDEDSQMYGGKPRRIGETWEIDAALLPGFEKFRAKGNITLKLMGERKVAGQRCAVIEGTLDAVMTMEGKDEAPDMKMALKGKLKVLRSLKYHEDIRMAFELENKMTFFAPGPNGPMKIDASGPMQFEGSVEIK